MKRMKKIIKTAVLLLICALLTVAFTLSGCFLFYSGEYTEDMRMFVGYSKIRKKAFVGQLSGDLENTDFVLPDEYMGCPVTTLGGYFGRGVPSPFCLEMELPEEYGEYVEEWRTFAAHDPELDETGDGWETVIFHVALGKNLRSIRYTLPCTYLGIEVDYDEEGVPVRDILYKIVPFFTVSEENETFYAEGGRLYYKDSGEPVGEFEYE